MTGDAKRLREQVKADRRLREQHTQLLTAGRAARDLAEAHAHRAATLEEELTTLKNKARVRMIIPHDSSTSVCGRPSFTMML